MHALIVIKWVPDKLFIVLFYLDLFRMWSRQFKWIYVICTYMFFILNAIGAITWLSNVSEANLKDMGEIFQTTKTQ